MTTAHLVHGYLGAGKTTFAAGLERTTGGIRLSADEWYLRLYAGEAPTAYLDPACWDRSWSVLSDLWPRLLAQGVDERAYEALRARFEPLGPDEQAELVDTTHVRPPMRRADGSA